jgi:hypothetical protein
MNAVCCETRTKLINALCRQNAEFLNVARYRAYINQCGLKGQWTLVIHKRRKISWLDEYLFYFQSTIELKTNTVYEHEQTLKNNVKGTSIMFLDIIDRLVFI